jgi:hypothetical protein
LHFGSPLSFLLDRFRQWVDARIESIEQLQQFLPAAVGPARQAQSLQLGAPLFCPSSALAPYSFVERDRRQLVHDSGAHLHQSMPLPKQWSNIAVLWTRHPDAREVVFHHQLQQLLCVLTIVLLFPHLLGSDLCRVSDPSFEVQLGQQALKPTRLPGRFDPDTHTHAFLLPFAIERFRFRAMRQTPLPALPGFRIDKRDLLHARVKIAAYNQHVRSPSSRAFGR